jgi:hypothetical protein
MGLLDIFCGVKEQCYVLTQTSRSALYVSELEHVWCHLLIFAHGTRHITIGTSLARRLCWKTFVAGRTNIQI